MTFLLNKKSYDEVCDDRKRSGNLLTLNTPLVSHPTIQRRGNSSGLAYLKKTAYFCTGGFSLKISAPSKVFV